jgi:hypothetical protein
MKTKETYTAAVLGAFAVDDTSVWSSRTIKSHPTYVSRLHMVKHERVVVAEEDSGSARQLGWVIAEWSVCGDSQGGVMEKTKDGVGSFLKHVRENGLR